MEQSHRLFIYASAKSCVSGCEAPRKKWKILASIKPGSHAYVFLNICSGCKACATIDVLFGEKKVLEKYLEEAWVFELRSPLFPWVVFYFHTKPYSFNFSISEKTILCTAVKILLGVEDWLTKMHNCICGTVLES